MSTPAARPAAPAEAAAAHALVPAQTGMAAVVAGAGQDLTLPVPSATQPSATCREASGTSAPGSGTTSRRLSIHRRAGAMCTFDIVTEVRTAAFSCMTHRLTGGVCDSVCLHGICECPGTSEDLLI